VAIRHGPAHLPGLPPHRAITERARAGTAGELATRLGRHRARTRTAQTVIILHALAVAGCALIGAAAAGASVAAFVIYRRACARDE
jgi:hypothetical protein